MASPIPVTETNLSWRCKWHRAVLTMDVTPPKDFIGDDHLNHNNILLTRGFRGHSSETDWELVIATNSVVDALHVTVGRYFDDNLGQDTKNLSWLMVREGSCIITFADFEPRSSPLTTGRIYPGGLVYDDWFGMPNGCFQLNFTISYSFVTCEERNVVASPSSTTAEGKLATDFEELFISGKESDFTFVVGEESIPAHKAVLVARAPYFEKLLASGMVESTTRSVKVDDADAATMRSVLRHIYSGKIPRDIDDAAMDLLPIADKYDLEDLKRACSRSLESNVAAANVIQTLILSDLHNCRELKEKCLGRIETWRSELSKDALLELQAYPDLTARVISGSRSTSV